MTQFSLKLLALVCMLCDHLSKVVLSSGFLTPVLGFEGELWIRTMLEVVGRIAFPIFAWFTAEGCRKTRAPGKYLFRLCIFAIISEIPFQLCFYGAGYLGIKLACHNVIFTMLLGAGAILCSNIMKELKMEKSLAVIIPSVIAVALGWFLHTDYNAWGVALIIFLYYLPAEKERLIFLVCWITVFMLIWHGWNGEMLVWLSGSNDYRLLLQWVGALFSAAFVASYNGKKGRGVKWLFYIFYPLHLTVLYLIRLCI